MIVVRDLCKYFYNARGEKVAAVDRLTFEAKPGEIYGLLGPNGAGKTTTLRVLCAVLRPDSGSVTVAGHDVAADPTAVRHRIGFLSANTGVYDRMTAWEMVEYYGQLHGMAPQALKERMEELFTTFRMNDFRAVVGGKLSTGMRQKVSIARALIHDPPVLIFDEPTNGLDVLVQRAVLQNIAMLRDRGKCVLFSTHIMREVEKLCDRVAIMHRGRILASGTPAELREEYRQPDLEEIFFSLVGGE